MTLISKVSGFKDKQALLLTLVVNPLVLPPLVVWATLTAYAVSGQSLWTAVAITTACFTLTPFIVMIIIAARNKEVTLELRNRKYRTIPFLVSIAASVVSVIFFARWDAPVQGLIFALMLAYLINNVLLFAINLRFKISLHMASVAGTASILFFMLAGPKPIPVADSGILLILAIVFAVLVPTMWWARASLDAHTKKELTWGTLFGLVIPPTELLLLTPLFA